MPSLGVVLVAGPVAGVGVAWAIVGFSTALQTRTPLAIQGRVSAAADLTLSTAQTVSIATGAVLSTVVDYRILFVVMAAVVLSSAGYLLTRRGADPGACDDGGVTELVPLRRNRDFVLFQSGAAALDLRVGDLGDRLSAAHARADRLGGEDRLRRRCRVPAARAAERRRPASRPTASTESA